MYDEIMGVLKNAILNDLKCTGNRCKARGEKNRTLWTGFVWLRREERDGIR
jgi:hypothetical protein